MAAADRLLTREGVGRSLLRKEDDRLLRGHGEFVADIKLPGTVEIAFVRSPLAHARIRGIGKPAGRVVSGLWKWPTMMRPKGPLTPSTMPISMAGP